MNERCLTPEFWDKKYKDKKSYYQLTNSDLMRIINEIPNWSSIVDVCCWKWELIEQINSFWRNYKICWLDFSQIAISEAKEEIKHLLKIWNIETDRIGFYDTIIVKYAIKYLSKKAILKIKNSCKQFIFIIPILFDKEEENSEHYKNISISRETLKEILALFKHKKKLFEIKLPWERILAYKVW